MSILWKRLGLTVGLLAILGAFTPGMAGAASVRNCGDYSFRKNLTTRSVSCSTARYHVRTLRTYTLDGSFSHRGYRCRVGSRRVGSATEFHDYYEADIRCTRGIKVIRWQEGIG